MKPTLRNGVKMAALAASTSIAILLTATGGLAQNNQGQNGNSQGQNGNNNGSHHPAPAPSIGGGLPGILLVGGVVLGTALVRRLRKA